MTDLSPAAQAVLDAANDAFDRAGTTGQGLAAALRAAADQVISSVPPPCEDFDEYAQGFLAAQSSTAPNSSPSPPNWSNSMTDSNGVLAAIVVLFFVVLINVWWLPQKWQACQKLYDNQTAQIICLLSK